jgi:SAM-dependent methyltransferase
MVLTQQDPKPGKVVQYYTETRADYALWSSRLNMHFGFWKPGMSLVDREAMLEQMNVEVADRLGIDDRHMSRVLDMGCGVGTAASAVARRRPGAAVTGVTLVPWQASEARGRRLASEEPVSCPSPSVILSDYTMTPFRDEEFDAVYSIESACYASGLAKEDLLREMARLVRRGGRFVVADAFLRRRDIANPVTRAAHRSLCTSWALETFGHIGAFAACAERVGFGKIAVEDISLNVLPSSLHVPAVTMRFLAATILAGGVPSRERWLNAATGGPLFLLAADPSAVGYFIVTATRR